MLRALRGNLPIEWEDFGLEGGNPVCYHGLMNDPRDFFSDITPRELAELRRVILPGEDIFWGTRPVPVFWGGGTAGILAFGSIWTGVTLLVTFGVLFGHVEGGGTPEPCTRLLWLLFLLPFWLIGITLLSAPWWEWHRLRRTLYVITTQRALIVAPRWFSLKTRAFELHEDMLLWRRVQKDAQGDLVFEAEESNDRSSYVGFLHLPDAQFAERKLREAIASELAIASLSR